LTDNTCTLGTFSGEYIANKKNREEKIGEEQRKKLKKK